MTEDKNLDYKARQEDGSHSDYKKLVYNTLPTAERILKTAEQIRREHPGSKEAIDFANRFESIAIRMKKLGVTNVGALKPGQDPYIYLNLVEANLDATEYYGLTDEVIRKSRLEKKLDKP
jgi:hypothetical protein